MKTTKQTTKTKAIKKTANMQQIHKTGKQAQQNNKNYG